MRDQKKLNYKPSPKRVEAILGLIPEIGGKIILDIGCADGTMGKIFKNQGNTVYGVDISKKDLQKAKKVLDKVFLVDLNQDKIPISSGSIDAVICSEVIEHLLPGNILLPEAHRVLKKNGILVITTPNFLYWGHRLQFLKGKFEYQKQGPFDESHVHFYTYQTLKKELVASGFKIVEEQHVFLSSKLVSVFLKKIPSFFAYQFVLKCQKSLSAVPLSIQESNDVLAV